MKTPRGISEYEFSCITRSIVLSNTRLAEWHRNQCVRDPPSGSSASTPIQRSNTRQIGHTTSVRPVISAHLAVRLVSFLTSMIQVRAIHANMSLLCWMAELRRKATYSLSTQSTSDPPVVKGIRESMDSAQNNGSDTFGQVIGRVFLEWKEASSLGSTQFSLAFRMARHGFTFPR